MAAVHWNSEILAHLRQEDKPILVDFWAPWCGYRRRINPVFDKIAEEYSHIVVAGKVNIDENPQLADAEQIEAIPTLVLYKHGEAIDSIVAPASKAMFDRFLGEALKKQ